MGTYTAPVEGLLKFGSLESGMDLTKIDFVKEFNLSAENIPDLIHMAIDPDLLKDEDIEYTEEDNLEFAGAVYALVALKQLKAEEAIEPLLTLYKNYPDNEWSMGELSRFYQTIGAKAIPVLTHFFSDWISNDDDKGYISESLGAIGIEHPETRLEVISALVSLLKKEENREANGAIVAQLEELQAVEAADDVKQAFEEGRVDEFYAGDWDEFQLDLGLREPTEEESKRRSLAPSFAWPPLPISSSTSTSYLPNSAPKAAPSKKKKEKQAKASRKQNRRKK